MGQDGLLRWKLPAWRPGRPSLRVRLAAAAVCLLAAGAGIIVVAGSLATRDHLARQAGQQLSGYASELARHPFLLTPLSRAAPVPGGPGPAGLGGLAAAGAGALTVEVRDSAGQLVMRAGPGGPAGPSGPGLHAAAVRVQADPRPADPRPAHSHPGDGRQAGTVRASRGGSYLAIAEPIHYRAHRIPYAYSAEDFTLDVTPAGTGSPGTLVVSLSLTPIGRATGHLTALMLAVSGFVVLAAAGLAAGMIHAMLRPPTQRLSATLSRLEQASDPAAGPGPAVRRATERRRQAVEDTSRELRSPLSVLAGLTEYYRHHDQLGPAGFDRLLDRVAEETARIGTLVETLERTGQDQPGRPGPGENVGGSA